MKKIFLLLGVVMMSFAISSCDLIDDAKECEDNLDITFELSPYGGVTENGAYESGYNVTFEVIKWRCDGSTTPMGVHTFMTTSEGRVDDVDYTFSLHNNNDYVTVTATCYGKYDFQEVQTQTQTFDSNNMKDGGYDNPWFGFKYTVEY